MGVRLDKQREMLRDFKPITTFCNKLNEAKKRVRPS